MAGFGMRDGLKQAEFYSNEQIEINKQCILIQ